MNHKPLHIISFDNPFPADYGGAIDVFYKIKALHALGFSLRLHCFVADRDAVHDQLKAITEDVYLYPKTRSPFHMLSLVPFSIKSRTDQTLLANLLGYPAPILFEGLQSASLLKNAKLRHYDKFLRMHNLESRYYSGMAASATSLPKKFVYYLESLKYKRFERLLSQFNGVFTLSTFEQTLVMQRFDNATYVPVFHGNTEIPELSGFGKFALYHGDLRIPDNLRAARFLVKVFEGIPDYELVIASGNGKEQVEGFIGKTRNVRFQKISGQDQLRELLRQAHISVMLSFQQSGTKLKLVNSLFNSRHCLINQNMVDDRRLLELCSTATTIEEFRLQIALLRNKPFDQSGRSEVLKSVLDDNQNASIIAQTISRT